MSSSFEIVGQEFVTGFRQQSVWKSWIAIAFFMGKIGIGLFLFALYLRSPILALVGILIEDIGYSGALMLHLGRPERFWRALSRPRTSWIARTVWMMGVFTVLGAIFLILPSASASWEVFRVLAAAAAVIVALLDGFIVNASPAIPLWNTAMMPLLFLFYTLLSGASLVLFGYHTGLVTVAWPPYVLWVMEVVLITINLLAVAIYLVSVANTTVAARASLNLLIKGAYAAMFYVLVVAVGFVFTLVMMLAMAATAGPVVVGAITVADLIGHFFIFYLLLLGGVYSPVFAKLTL
ncbi:MAG: polysulfide reductase NrfD [Peptococcaceae bacterium]|jgi:formate-dependent nitrite reductase membrane component NrfD|nr:polysulfide reductase NrfD [Peptococcaceae bacterium]